MTRCMHAGAPVPETFLTEGSRVLPDYRCRVFLAVFWLAVRTNLLPVQSISKIGADQHTPTTL